MPRFPFLPLLLAAAIPVAVGIASCTAAPAKGLLIAVQTDLSVTKDFDKLGLYITVDGKPVFANEYPFDSGGKVRLPSSLALLPTDNAAAVVRVRAVAFRKGEARVLRQAITTIPHERAALLRMPLEWLAAGTSTKGTEGDFIANPFAHTLNLCGNDDDTSDKGICITSSFPVESLPDYDPAELYGGGDETGAGGGCFDTAACFASNVKLVPDGACTVPFAGSAAGLNVAVATTTGEGEPVGGSTLVALNQDAWTLSNGLIHLPAALCQAPKSTEMMAVALSTSCAPKTEAFPICGPFSTGTPLPLLGDAGPLPLIDGGTDADAGPLPPIEDFGSAEPDVSTVVVGPQYIYAVGSDPNNGAAFRLFYFAKAGSAAQGPIQTFPLSGADSPVSAAIAINAGMLVVAQALPDQSSGALDVFPLAAGVPANSPASIPTYVEAPALALSAVSLFHSDVTDFSLTRRSLSDPSIVDPVSFAGISGHRVVSMAIDASAPVLYVGTQDGFLFRVDQPDDIQVPQTTTLLTDLDTGGMPIGGIAVVPGGNHLVLSMPAPTGPGEIAWVPSSLDPDGGVADAGVPVTPLSTTDDLAPLTDVHATRYRGIATDGNHVYFAAADGLRYVSIPNPGPSTLLKAGIGVFGLDVDPTHVYWTAMDLDSKNLTALHKGIGRALLLP